jgi:DNA primase
MTDIEDLKEEVSILDVLGHYGAETWKATYHGHGWVAINCPLCHDTNGSASVNVSTGYFNCHQCDAPRDGRAGDIIDVVQYEEHLSVEEAIEWIRSTFLT